MQPDLRIAIGGLYSTDDTPGEYRRHLGGEDAPSTRPLTSAIEFLNEHYRAEERDVAYYDEQVGTSTDSGAWKPAPRHTALVNPDWLGTDAGATGSGIAVGRDRQNALWHIPTSRYDATTPAQLYDPLVEAIETFRDADGDPMNIDVFGEIRLYRDGGELEMDLFFDGLHASGDVESTAGNALTFGVMTGYDYFGSTSLYAEPIAFDDGSDVTTGDASTTVLRRLSDRKKRRRVGDESAAEVAGWWGGMLSRLEEATDSMLAAIADAQRHTVPINDYPVGMVGFYEHLGFSGDLSREASGAARERFALGEEPSAWVLARSAMWALEHTYDAKTGGSAFRSYVKLANKLLFRPDRAEEDVAESIKADLRREYETATESDGDGDVADYLGDGADGDGGPTLEEVTGVSEDDIAKMNSRIRNVVSGAEDYRSTRSRLRTIFDDIEAQDGEDDASDSTDADGGEGEGAADGGEKAATDGGLAAYAEGDDE